MFRFLNPGYPGRSSILEYSLQITLAAQATVDSYKTRYIQFIEEINMDYDIFYIILIFTLYCRQVRDLKKQRPRKSKTAVKTPAPAPHRKTSQATGKSKAGARGKFYGFPGHASYFSALTPVSRRDGSPSCD